MEFLVSDSKLLAIQKQMFQVLPKDSLFPSPPPLQPPPPTPSSPQPFVLVGVVNSVPVSEQIPLEADPDVNQVLQPPGYQSEHDKAEQTCRLDAIAAVWMKCPTIYRRRDKL